MRTPKLTEHEVALLVGLVRKQIKGCQEALAFAEQHKDNFVQELEYDRFVAGNEKKREEWETLLEKLTK